MVTKRIIRPLHVLAIASIVFSTACAAEPAAEGQDAPSDEPKDTRGAEVPASPPPTNTSTPSEAPALLAWGFEPASGDCNGWPALGADTVRAVPARSGAYSCKVCSNGSSAEVGLARELGTVRAGRYVLTAWVRKRVQTVAPPEALARIDAVVNGASVSATAKAIPIRDEWDRLEATLDLAGDASTLRVTIGSPAAEAQHCLFVDDVMLVRQ